MKNLSEEKRKAFDLKQKAFDLKRKAFDFLKMQEKETQKKSFTTSPHMLRGEKFSWNRNRDLGLVLGWLAVLKITIWPVMSNF